MNKDRRNMHKRLVKITLPTVALIMVLLWSFPASGHKVNVFAWVEGNTVYTESRFSAGKMVQNGKIEVYDMKGNKLLEGTTDENGLFNFPVPAKEDIKVVLVAGMGHGNHWIVKAQELSDASTAPAVSAPQPPPQPVVTVEPSVQGNAVGTCVDAKTIEQIVNRALEKKIGGLEAQLVGQGPKFREIVAGFGYILGLVGLAAYMRFRKTGKQA